MEILFFTHNDHKLKEGGEILARIGVRLKKAHTALKKEEIRANDVREVALFAAAKIWPSAPKPFLIEDSGLFIKALGGFPGPYSAWVKDRIGLEGVLNLMRNKKDRSAEFRCALALGTEEGIRLFIGSCKGTIACEIRGSEGFGFDPIFIPEGYSTTFAEDESIKKKCSHRTRAFNAFATWLKGQLR